MTISQNLGAAIRKHREHIGLSQEELADRAGLDRTYISGIERGRRNPTLDVLERISSALGIGLDVVFVTARDTTLKDRA